MPTTFITDDDSTNEAILVHDIARMMKKHFDRRAKAMGLTRAQWMALSVLRRNVGINQVELADKLDVEPMTVARLVDRLEEAKWVERRTDPVDRRAKRLYLTPRAQQIANQLRVLGLEVRYDALAGVTAKEHAELARILNKIRQNVCTGRACPKVVKE